MTIYNVTAIIGQTYVSELIEIDTTLSPEDEIQLAEDTLIDKWTDLFKYDFNSLAEEITSFALSQSQEF